MGENGTGAELRRPIREGVLCCAVLCCAELGRYFSASPLGKVVSMIQ